MLPRRNLYHLNRRDFLRLSATLGAGALVSACSGDRAPNPTASAAATQQPLPSATLPPAATPAPSVSLEQMIGQMLMVGFRGYTVADDDPIRPRLLNGTLGNVVLFDVDGPTGGGRNIQSPSQVQALTAQLRNLAATAPIISADEEGGYVARLKPAYGFPATVSEQTLGDRNDPAYTKQVTSTMAKTLSNAGINLNLAPVMDVNVNPNNPVIGSLERSFSSDPDVVTEQGLAFIDAHHEQGVLCTMKHFPGHGSSTADSHLGFVDVTGLWTPMELEPFANVINAGKADAIMTAHIFNSAWDDKYPATLSKAVLTGMLREQLGFEGVILTDDMQMGAIRQYYGFETAIELTINAGADVLSIANNGPFDPDVAQRAFDAVSAAVQAGRVSEERIAQSYKRIMKMKQRLA
jgi:beta-N-acetylhexosaminidase